MDRLQRFRHRREGRSSVDRRPEPLANSLQDFETPSSGRHTGATIFAHHQGPLVRPGLDSPFRQAIVSSRRFCCHPVDHGNPSLAESLYTLGELFGTMSLPLREVVAMWRTNLD